MIKNYTLYVFEGIFSLSIVILHCSFKGWASICVETISRIAVPLFYIISGIFLRKKLEDTAFKIKIKNKIKKLFLISTFLMVFYFVFDVLMIMIFKMESINDYLKIYINPKNIILFLLFNNMFSTSSTHLWFLFGLIYSYVIIFLLYKYINLKKILISLEYYQL